MKNIFEVFNRRLNIIGNNDKIFAKALAVSYSLVIDWLLSIMVNTVMLGHYFLSAFPCTFQINKAALEIFCKVRY